MKAIKIIKPNQTKATNETPVETKKPVEPTTNRLAHTIKGWIAESRERKRTQRFSLQPSVGKYELTIQRRLACCDGPMVESNKINFEVVP